MCHMDISRISMCPVQRWVQDVFSLVWHKYWKQRKTKQKPLNNSKAARFKCLILIEKVCKYKYYKETVWFFNVIFNQNRSCCGGC